MSTVIEKNNEISYNQWNQNEMYNKKFLMIIKEFELVILVSYHMAWILAQERKPFLDVEMKN